ncbi:MAG: Uma2 family endonuclease [Thermodesulfovibrionales bacterium]
MERLLKIEDLPRYTYEDYKHWEGRWELIEGIAYAMSPQAGFRHQRISNRIAAQLETLLEGCERCYALLPVDWRINDNTVLNSDNLVYCGELKGDYLTEPPVLIFEILSPSTAFKDRNIKYRIYEAMKVKYYVIIDIELNIAEIYELKKEHYTKIKETRDETIHFDLSECTINFDFSKIW